MEGLVVSVTSIQVNSVGGIMIYILYIPYFYI